jgi:hypothetical protein
MRRAGHGAKLALWRAARKIAKPREMTGQAYRRNSDDRPFRGRADEDAPV